MDNRVNDFFSKLNAIFESLIENGYKLLWETESKSTKIFYLIDDGKIMIQLFTGCDRYCSSIAYYNEYNRWLMEWDINKRKLFRFTDEKSTEYELRIFKEYSGHDLILNRKHGRALVTKKLLNLKDIISGSVISD